MPLLSRYFIRSSLLCMALGFTIGGLMLAVKGGALDGRLFIWLPVHIVLLVNGWLIQLSIGVAYWIFPRVQLGERGRRSWAWAAFGFFEVGLVLVIASGVNLWIDSLSALFAPGVIFQLVGVGLFGFHAWVRIRSAMVRATASTPR